MTDIEETDSSEKIEELSKSEAVDENSNESVERLDAQNIENAHFIKEDDKVENDSDKHAPEATEADGLNEEKTDNPTDEINQEETGINENEESVVEVEEIPKVTVLDTIRKLITFPAFKEEENWTDEIVTMVEEEFIRGNQQVMIAYMHSKAGLQVEFSFPVMRVAEYIYFIKDPHIGEELLSVENFDNFIQYGMVSGNGVESLLRLMGGVYSPTFFETTTWPDSIKNEFTLQLHRFMSSLTDTRFKLEGKTVLYVPTENANLSSEEAGQNKDFVQRMEMIMIHWTRQIKEVLSSQNAFEDAENLGPLEEIEFWKNRCEDLSGISKQLDKDGVKRITTILQIAKSSYVNAFIKLASEIKANTQQAQSNLKFLNSLKDQCHELADARPRDIPQMLPRLINRIRMIWINSDHYNSQESVTGMFRKLSNEIIRRCCKEISLEKIFDGFINSSIQNLTDCVECCEAYKDVYNKAARMHHKFSKTPWTLDKSSIFAQIDAFIQRCKDLLEVCDCQKNIVRYEEGFKNDMPIFGGARGVEIESILVQVEHLFAKHLRVLKDRKSTILDVKATSWHDDYNRFRAGVKDLEVMIQNAINTALDTITTVEQGVEILDVFAHLQNREAIRRTIDKKTIEVYQLFNDELNIIKSELSNRTFSGMPHPAHPRLAGTGHWARMLKKRIERSMAILDRAHFLPVTGTGKEIRTQYQLLCQALDESVRKLYIEFQTTLERNVDPNKALEIPVLCRSVEQSGMLDINFNKNLLKLFQELYYWERLSFEIPHWVLDIYKQKAALRVIRERVLMVVRDYNRIIFSLSTEERALFRERIKVLDKKIAPAMTKQNWKSDLSVWIISTRTVAHEIQKRVDEYKSSNLNVSKLCKLLSETLLVKIEYNRIYENHDFKESQDIHRVQTLERLHDIHKDIVQIMLRTYNQTFQSDGHEVQQHWIRYTEKMDRMCEEAFRLNVKWSLAELNKGINGDGRNEPSPLFKVALDLENDQIAYIPSLADLSMAVTSMNASLTHSIRDISRLQDILTKKKSHRSPIHEIITRDEEILKIQNQIVRGMNDMHTIVGDAIAYWDEFREIWEIEKESFIDRYRMLNPRVASFDADIGRYTEVTTKVLDSDAMVTTRFLQLDYSLLKNSIAGHCKDWQHKLTNLLLEIATNSLMNIYNYLQREGERVSKPPQTLDELGESLDLWDKLNGELHQIEDRFVPLTDQFAILEKYEVTLSDEATSMYNGLQEAWESFKSKLIDAEMMLKKHKEKFKASLLAQAEEFKKQVNILVDEFHNTGPFSSNIPCEEALTTIEAIRAQLETLKEQEAMLRRGLNIFKIEQPPSKEIAVLEKDLEYIETIWKLIAEWEENWSQWKVGKFSGLQTSEMADLANNTFRKLSKLARELKDKNWEVVEVSKNKVDQFRRTMPLITDLKNTAMRERHWHQLKGEMSKQFDETGDDFTLEKIIELGFDAYADVVSEISGAASKELAIENSLKKMEEIWNFVDLDIIAYKDKGHFKIRGTEEVYQQLEDHQVQLSTMKASRFVKPFEQLVDQWERDLSHILETLETLQVVQRQWMYLENIFMGDDIRKQLPKESSDFEDINNQWKSIMSEINKTKNARSGTKKQGLLEHLNNMNSKLEDIQKSLDMYLETKRQIFPRFYFISNDDLLEILGQSKNPDAVQPHLKKCFDNIVKLVMTKTNVQGWEASEMISEDTENVTFRSKVRLEGPVEAWLCDVERNMRTTLKEIMRDCRLALKKMMTKRDRWIRDWPGQVCITTSQIQWTADVTKALQQVKERNDKKPLRSFKKKQVVMLNKFSDLIRKDLKSLERKKVNALVVIEVHHRDIIEKLYKTGCNEVTSFDWLAQLRFYWEKELDDCLIRQTNTSFHYGYEYLGNSGRLVITPLTDRCYITLTTALHLHRGGSPKGPAGTGKTETVKDLGKSLGNYVIVVNCSEGLDYKSMGRMFSGLSQTGAWGCFDEFNRINIEVLSVVAQQILSILSALASHQERFIFEGRMINLIWCCGIFITMNPGYAGRTELPDNLKSMFRPISMVTPDSNLIAEITLFAEGFGNTKLLAKKVYTMYNLAVQQLSKQDHYDFGLRALVSVLRYAGRKKRANPTMSDEELLLLSMNDMNLAKLTSVDLPLFMGIVSDLFPGVESPTMDYSKFKSSIEQQCLASGLQPTKFTLDKVIQLYETKNSRHSVMIVGQTLSGKSTTWKLLRDVMTSLAKSGDTNYTPAKEYALNPKSLSLGELYGEFDLNSNEWTDGVLSSLMRQTCADEKSDQKWILFDGPVDTLWIESMNSVMDDNKILTLINGERIGMPEQVSLLFEVEDLSVASPATVSRCGMVYNDYVDLGWKPFVESWILAKSDKIMVEELRRLFDKYLEKLYNFVRLNCFQLVPISQLNGVISLTRLFDVLATPDNGCDPNDSENYTRMIELLFQYCLIWSICCSVDEDGRKKIDNYVREMEGTFPNKDTIYEYFVEPKAKSWAHWDERLRSGWKYNPSAPFYQITVPTVDTIRYSFLVSNLVQQKYPVLLVGPVGTGKTSVANSVIQNNLDSSKWSVLTVNMSAQTTSNNIQNIIESRVEKRTKGIFVPIGGKNLLTFMDDLNMPAKDTFGSQPPLELIRQWVDYGMWYDRIRQTSLKVQGMYLLAAMGPPGGGRMIISRRLQSRFNLINMTFPSETNLKRIFGSMINQKLQDFEEEVKPIGDIVTQATIEMYNAVVARFLPTPTKIHYLFNLRDISKVFQGMLRANKSYHDTKTALTRLWINECFHVFADRLVDEKDYESFMGILSEKLGILFDQTFHGICPSKKPPIFGDFMNPDQVYEDISDEEKLKKHMNDMLDEYNNTPGVLRVDLVLFKDAIEHLSKIIRVIRQPRGNMLLIGIGGSGRQSLSRLSAFICDYKIFQIEVTKHYRLNEFRDDLKRLYWQSGVENQPTLFIFNDTQVVEESFLEDINNILSSGEVPNLYKADEFEEVRNALSDAAKKEGIDETPQVIFNFLINRVRANLHIVLCMSPVGEAFRNRVRMYPAFVNCTTIDWFGEWPHDALLEVAEKYLRDLNFGTEDEAKKFGKLKVGLARIFSFMHKSVLKQSVRMLDELRRYNYVTPTNYLELVTGYKRLLLEKRKSLGDAAQKLKNGLGKIDDTREKVELMSVELESAKKQVAEYQKTCDEFLVVIVQQKREADEQQKSVASTREKIAVDQAKCHHMKELALADLSEAMPALNEAMKALESLNKKDVTEIKSYGKPPYLVQKVMEAVMILRGCDISWAESKRNLGENDFIGQLVAFDKDNMSDRTLKKIGQYCAADDFQPDVVGKVSTAARSLCMWVRAMELYGRIYRVVEPKRQRLLQAEAVLAEKEAQLKEAEEKLAAIEKKMDELQEAYKGKMDEKDLLRQKAEHTEKMLDRASKLVSGLSGEKIRWEETVASLEMQISFLPGDCLISSAFLSYLGPFLSNYRDELCHIWAAEIKKETIPLTENFVFTEFMVKPTQIRDWTIQGLPSDSFSVENGVIVTRGTRWPLMIDPQCQAQKWIKNMEGKNLIVIDLQQSDYMRRLEMAIQYGKPVLLQNVSISLDPSLDPILNKSIIKIGGAWIIKLGDKEIEYNNEFRFYITTKLPNPHYTPEISTKTTIVNFAVKEQGLEAQLLGIVVRKERPELEEQKDKLVMSIAAGKKKINELEDEILRLLNEAQGSLLDDEHLVNTLQTSKITSSEVAEQLQISEKNEILIDQAREGYRPCSSRASILFFVLNDMGRIDPMYQFSLDAYIDLFILSIDKSPRSGKLEERIQNLNNHHTYTVYKFTCRGLFERHKLLFSFQMCAKILEAAGKLNIDEYNFFLRGGIVLDRENQMDNPCSNWLREDAWDNVTELDKLANFHGVVTSFEQYPRDWNMWYTSSEPESAPLPGEWDNSTNEFQRMLIVRSLRPDRVAFCATSFIVNNLGSKFVEPPVLEIKAVVDDSTSRTPLIFVLSPGVDPTNGLLQIAESCGMGKKFHALSLGQGQAPIATRLIRDGIREGNWVFLANCHLSLSWMPQLDKLVEQLQYEETHPEFRLWLSSSPHPSFPISILQNGIKMTTEPPKGLKANMKRLYVLIKDEQFQMCKKPDKYRKLLFSLCFFHSILLERRKFLMLGWNIPYDFNDSDFEVSENLLTNYLDQYEDTPWEALKFLIAEINYGGHVTDDFDRRLLNTYITQFFCDEAMATPFYKMSILPHYYIPRDGSLSSYKEYVSMLPNIDHPEAFGQHSNADITSQIQETRLLFHTLLSLQPQVSVAVGGETREDKVLELAANVNRQLPENIDYENTAKLLSVDPSPLNVVLLQEIERYNLLLDLIRKQLNDLEKGIQGLVVMSSDLEDIFQAIYDARVPLQWAKVYPSMKPLASWTRDLVQRVDQFAQWAMTARPPLIFWMSGFAFPTGFLTAVLQTAARQNSVSVDSLSWDFTVLTYDDRDILGPPKDGVFIRGLYLQGAGWDKKGSNLIEANPMQLVCQMPTINFKPSENKKKSLKSLYMCPCYYYPNRNSGAGRPSFVVAVELKTGEKQPDHWVKRGTALLMSLDS